MLELRVRPEQIERPDKTIPSSVKSVAELKCGVNVEGGFHRALLHRPIELGG